MPIPSKAALVTFFKTEPFISSVNFAMTCGSRTYRVYASAYRLDVADAIDKERIKVTSGVIAGAAAAYSAETDVLTLKPTFDLTSTVDQAILVHECTHAHLDLQRIGLHPFEEDEAVGYVAESVFWIAAGGTVPLSADKYRAVAMRIGAYVAKGVYSVLPKDAADLMAEIKAASTYAKAPSSYPSNAFDRDVFKQIGRLLR